MLALGGMGATGALGGAAQAVTLGAGGYKLAGVGTDAAMNKIKAVGQKRGLAYGKNIAYGTPGLGRLLTYMDGSEEAFDKAQAQRDNIRKTKASTQAAKILAGKSDGALLDSESRMFRNLSSNHLMSNRNESFSKTFENNKHIGGYEWARKVQNETDIEDIMSKDGEDMINAMNEDGGLLKAAFKGMADEGGLNDFLINFKFKDGTRLSDEEKKNRLFAHMYLSPD